MTGVKGKVEFEEVNGHRIAGIWRSGAGNVQFDSRESGLVRITVNDKLIVVRFSSPVFSTGHLMCNM